MGPFGRNVVINPLNVVINVVMTKGYSIPKTRHRLFKGTALGADRAVLAPKSTALLYGVPAPTVPSGPVLGWPTL